MKVFKVSQNELLMRRSTFNLIYNDNIPTFSAFSELIAQFTIRVQEIILPKILKNLRNFVTYSNIKTFNFGRNIVYKRGFNFKKCILEKYYQVKVVTMSSPNIKMKSHAEVTN